MHVCKAEEYMKVAFDVKGTLKGLDETKVWKLFHILEARGCEIVIWSNMITFAHDVVREKQLNNDFIGKKDKYDLEEDEWFDVAVEDDRSQDYLAAKRFVFVGDIPEDDDAIYKLANDLLGEQ
jgi:hypothetical protein